jgi:hypothetical protein
MNHDRSIVGRPRHQGVMVGMGQKDSYVGLVIIDIFIPVCDLGTAETRRSRSAVFLR